MEGKESEGLSVGVMKDMLAKLKVGDGIYAPIILHGRRITLQVAVLRISDEAFYLSVPANNCWTARLSQRSPFYWDQEKDALVDRSGEIPMWYSVSMSSKSGVALSVAVQYASVPRIQDNTMRLDPDFLEAFRSSTLSGVIDGILENGESGMTDTQVKLFCDNVGIPLMSQPQLAALTVFCEMHALSKIEAFLKMMEVDVVAAMSQGNENHDNGTPKGDCSESDNRCGKPTVH